MSELAELTPLLGNRQRLDGGAMFGNAPRAVWERWIPPDDLNRIPLACRCMLVRDGDRLVLCETGIGAYADPSFRARFGVDQERHVLLDALAALGLSDGDVDVVVLSHLHFDHAGGLLSAWSEGQEASLLFPNATFLVSETAWDRAVHPHPRDKASFIETLPKLLEASDRLVRLTSDGQSPLGAKWRFHPSDGHTPGMMLAEFASQAGPTVFAADLIPGLPWVHIPITMGYDRFPELLIEEKSRLLQDLHRRSGRLFFTHDPDIAVAKVQLDAKGRYFGQPDAP